MGTGAGLRRATYGGTDPQTDKAFRGMADQMSYFQKLPTSNGVLLADQDFGAATTDASYPLNHQLGRKARGVSVISCRTKTGTPTTCPANPVHDSANTGENNTTAFVFLTTDMAANFIWSIWVW